VAFTDGKKVEEEASLLMRVLVLVWLSLVVLLLLTRIGSLPQTDS
jgi:hypothetical protein